MEQPPRRKPAGRLSAKQLRQIDDSMDFNPSEACTLSCGTICVDPRTANVLLIYNKKLNLYQLPK